MSDELMSLIQDYALIEDFLLNVSHCIVAGSDMPDHIPMLNNGLLTDTLGVICEKLRS